MNDLLAEAGLASADLSPKQQNALCREIGARMMNAIDSQTMVNPQSLVAGALLAGGREFVSQDELMFRIDASMDLFISQGTCISEVLAEDCPASVNAALHYYKNRKIIQFVAPQVKGGPQTYTLRISENRRNALDYYKNISVCHLIPAAFTAISILEKDAFQFSAADLHYTYLKIQQLFSEEFNINPVHPPAYIVRKVVKAFIDNAVLVPHPAMPDTYNLPAEGFRKLLFFSGIIEPFLESYVTTLTYLAKNRRNHHTRPKMLKKILAIGNRMFRQGEIRLKESISKANYDNAISFFNRNGVKGSEDEEAIRGWNKLLSHFRDLISR
jgi:glycerol-3-phosphate O-acyltransferase